MHQLGTLLPLQTNDKTDRKIEAVCSVSVQMPQYWNHMGNFSDVVTPPKAWVLEPLAIEEFNAHAVQLGSEVPFWQAIKNR